MKAKRIALAAALVLGLGAGAVFAQPGYGYGPGYGMHGYGMGPGYGMGYGMGPGSGMGYGMGPGYGRGPGYGAGFTIDDRLAVMKSRLGITPAQEKAWQAFAAKSKAQSESAQKLHEQFWAGGVPATAEERAARHTEMLKARLEQSESMTQALKQLDAALTPDQRAILDRGGLGAGFGPGGRWR